MPEGRFVGAEFSRLSPFDQIFDVVVVGAGYAGFAAAIALRRTGKQVLLADSRGDLLWESGRSFCPDAGVSDAPGWQSLVAGVERRGGGVAGTWLDGAIAEVVGTDQLLDSGAAVLYYAHPVAIERVEDSVESLILATKSGIRRVAGQQWIDATETADLLRLVDPTLRVRPPRRTDVYLMLQHHDWPGTDVPPGLSETAWPTERVASVEVKADDPAWREQVLVALGELERELGKDIGEVSMSHLSIEPISQYDAGDPPRRLRSNVASAVPGLASTPIATLADRFELGLSAVRELSEYDVLPVDAAVLRRALPSVTPVSTLAANVCVAGLGTGGAVAALAASRVGGKVVCVEPLTFLGGIGTGGGIHAYYFGVAGGLQQEVDLRTRELMKRFRGGPLGDGPFNPWAKMIALEQLLREAGVEQPLTGLLFDVERQGDRVVAALVATSEGVVRIEAAAYVDGTGDGDLCALAGAEFIYGREHDGMSHAYSQSSGALRDLRGRPRMSIVNFDAGFCDPTDPEDLTRARMTGIRQYLIDRFENLSRPTYIAPALGLRQSRQVVTDYMLTLDDQILGRTFDDPIGFTGSHYDNHATDYEFESDEALFWVWLNRQYLSRLACELSYRMLVPRGLGNVWIASRCIGVTQDAHYSARMQRDMQRVGEAAGFAAGEAARLRVGARHLPYEEVLRRLDGTGALSRRSGQEAGEFGHYDFSAAVEVAGTDTSSRENALAALDRGEPGTAIWWLHRHRAEVRDDVLERLTAADRPAMVRWLAAGVVAMWSDVAAQPRLIEAIDGLEYGFGDDFPIEVRKEQRIEPLTTGYLVPNWLCAIGLLRRCGTADCLPALGRLLDHRVHGINTLTTAALTIERLASRGALDDARDKAVALLDRMLGIRVLGVTDYPQREVGRFGENAVRDGATAVDSVGKYDGHVPASRMDQMRNVAEDNTWQLHLAVARARVALGLSPHDALVGYLTDERLHVRRVFASI